MTKNKWPPNASKEFWDALISASSLVVECEFCERTHYCINEYSGDYSEGELEELKIKERENPDKYVSHDDLVPWGYLDGKQMVYDCSCNSAGEYEELFWNNRYFIPKYFEKKAKSLNKQSIIENKIAQSVGESGDTKTK